MFPNILKETSPRAVKPVIADKTAVRYRQDITSETIDGVFVDIREEPWHPAEVQKERRLKLIRLENYLWESFAAFLSYGMRMA